MHGHEIGRLRNEVGSSTQAGAMRPGDVLQLLFGTIDVRLQTGALSGTSRLNFLSIISTKTQDEDLKLCRTTVMSC